MIHRVNFDYDQALLKNDASFENPKINKMFEYVYFLINKESSNKLFNYEEYDPSYLKYLEDKGFVVPEFTRDKACVNWWADISNLEKSKELESKVVTLEIARELELAPKSAAVIHNETELNNYLNNRIESDFYYRSEFGFSGTGNKIIDKNKKYSLRYPGVIAPYFERILSFGVTVSLRKKSFYIIKNNIDTRGVFTGGEVLTIDELSKYLSIPNEEIDSSIREVMNLVESKFGKIDFQFDSFVYKEDSTVKWYKLVEINYRRTMGEIIKSLTERFGQGRWIIEKNNYNSKDHLELQKILEKKHSRKIVITSPLNHKLMSYYLY